jgi:hypothetical protein
MYLGMAAVHPGRRDALSLSRPTDWMFRSQRMISETSSISPAFAWTPSCHNNPPATRVSAKKGICVLCRPQIFALAIDFL